MTEGVEHIIIAIINAAAIIYAARYGYNKGRKHK